MPREREAEYKPLSFSTTMRNPARIAGFLNCLLPFEGKILTNDVIMSVAQSLIRTKLYTPMYVGRTPRLKSIISEDRNFTDNEVAEIIDNSPQKHKEAGFEKGWPSRFDTWYKLAMEFGFVYYAIGDPIVVSTTGHMLVDAYNENPINDEKIKNVFQNALVKYQTNNPFRKTLNANAPLVLLLQVLKLLKDDPEETDAGIFKSELSLLICWQDNDANALYKRIKELRHQYRFTYGDEVIYDICLELLGATREQSSRFKINQITGEAVDEFIRKMRITGIVSLRGNGRFIDFNTFESEKIQYILDNYGTYEQYRDKLLYFNYMGTIDANIVSMVPQVNEEEINDIRIATLNRWATDNSKEFIISELDLMCRNGESRNPVLRIIDKPTRFEFLISIALKQNFEGLLVKPNYHVDDEGLPTFTASGGLADIECFDTDCNPLVEVTLMCARNQATNEMPAITRHLQEAIAKYPGITVFSVLVAPSIHADTMYMAGFSKFQYGIDIIPLTTSGFIKLLKTNDRIINLLKGEKV